MVRTRFCKLPFCVFVLKRLAIRASEQHKINYDPRHLNEWFQLIEDLNGEIILIIFLKGWPSHSNRCKLFWIGATAVQMDAHFWEGWRKPFKWIDDFCEWMTKPLQWMQINFFWMGALAIQTIGHFCEQTTQPFERTDFVF